jgi:pyrroline-5-carboxylate reductase
MTDPASPVAHLPRSLVLVGAGKMGGALLEGWLASGLPGNRVTIIDPEPSPSLARTSAASGVRVVRAPGDASAADVLVLAVKPQAFPEVAASLAPLVATETLLVSVMAGTSVSTLRRSLPGSAAIVRAMPNLPAAIRRGATGAYASEETCEGQRLTADALLKAIGLVEWVGEEALIDAVTALSGSGPAYLFHLVECMAEAGVAAGLEPALAARLARATVVGAAELIETSGEEPARLRENVTSPGGTTAAALAVLRGADGLGPLMERAVLAARARAAELSG